MSKNIQAWILSGVLLSGLSACGGDSDSSTQKTDNSAPSTSDITSVTAVAGSGSKLLVSWSEASDPGGSATSQLLYRIMISDNGGGQWREADSVIGVTSATLTKLHSNTAYKVGVIVEDEAGNQSAQSSANANDSATTNAMSFSADVYDIIQSNCTASSCHTNVGPSGNQIVAAAGLALNGNAMTVYQTLTAQRNVNCGGLKALINTTGSDIIADSYLDDLLDPAARNSIPAPCSNPMPKDKPLSANDFAVVYDWLADGVQN